MVGGSDAGLTFRPERTNAKPDMSLLSSIVRGVGGRSEIGVTGRAEGEDVAGGGSGLGAWSVEQPSRDRADGG